MSEIWINVGSPVRVPYTGSSTELNILTAAQAAFEQEQTECQTNTACIAPWTNGLASLVTLRNYIETEANPAVRYFIESLLLMSQDTVTIGVGQNERTIDNPIPVQDRPDAIFTAVQNRLVEEQCDPTANGTDPQQPLRANFVSAGSQQVEILNAVIAEFTTRGSSAAPNSPARLFWNQALQLTRDFRDWIEWEEGTDIRRGNPFFPVMRRGQRISGWEAGAGQRVDALYDSLFENSLAPNETELRSEDTPASVYTTALNRVVAESCNWQSFVVPQIAEQDGVVPVPAQPFQNQLVTVTITGTDLPSDPVVQLTRTVPGEGGAEATVVPVDASAIQIAEGNTATSIVFTFTPAEIGQYTIKIFSRAAQGNPEISADELASITATRENAFEVIVPPPTPTPTPSGTDYRYQTPESAAIDDPANAAEFLAGIAFPNRDSNMPVALYALAEQLGVAPYVSFVLQWNVQGGTYEQPHAYQRGAFALYAYSGTAASLSAGAEEANPDRASIDWSGLFGLGIAHLTGRPNPNNNSFSYGASFELATDYRELNYPNSYRPGGFQYDVTGRLEVRGTSGRNEYLTWAGINQLFYAVDEESPYHPFNRLTLPDSHARSARLGFALRHHSSDGREHLRTSLSITPYGLLDYPGRGVEAVTPSITDFQFNLALLWQRRIDVYLRTALNMRWLHQDGRSASPAWDAELALSLGFRSLGQLSASVLFGGNPDLYNPGGGYGGFSLRWAFSRRVPLFLQVVYQQFFRDGRTSDNTLFGFGYNEMLRHANSPIQPVAEETTVNAPQ